MLLALFVAVFASHAAQPVTFNFTLGSAKRTSAGIFKADGTLMRTIWSGVPYPAGVNSASWEGTDDFGNLVPDGAYNIRVLSNACTYTWEGVLGNTSSSFTGPQVWKSYNHIGGLAINGTTAYYGNGYAEAGSTSGKFSTTAPNSTKQLILGKGPDVWNVATDGTLVYWSGADPNANTNTFVFGTRVSDDTQFPFASGVSYTVLYGLTLTNAIDKRTDGSPVSGLAVQKTGALLFVSHVDKNELKILNKTTGAVVQTITGITSPGALAVDGGDNLWLARKNGVVSEVAQYSVAADGTLTQLQVLAATFDTPMALGVSPDNATLVVVDGGLSQQLKAFAVSGGAAAWTFGQAGGYTVAPTVSDDRFMFEGHTFVAFQPDGTFWIGDFGNGRIQHYTAARAFIERVQYRQYSYFCSVDENSPTRVFSDFLEYAVDYSLPLAPDNGSWSLVRNWTKLVPTGYGGSQYRRIYPCTLGNGRTYALIPRNTDQKHALFEMTAAGQFRNTGILTTTTNAGMQPDGSIRTVNSPAVGGTITWTKAVLTGFDASNNPTYATAATLASTAAAATDPAWWGDSNHIRPGVQTTGDIVVSYDHSPPDAGVTRGTGYHLGGVRVGGTGWLWRTSMATHKNYAGAWPADGAFDIGNGVLNAGSLPMTVDHHIFYGYYGEFYRGSQVNKYRHYYDSGLFVGEFGEIGDEVGNNAGGAQCPAKMAGNALNPWVVKLPDGRVFLYHNDESWHGGVHRWRIDGLDTVAEQSMPIVWSAPTVAGLRGEYFDTADLDSAAVKTIRTDSAVNFNWGAAIPAGTAITAADTWSARWSGFVAPLYSQTYTFYTGTDDGNEHNNLTVNLANQGIANATGVTVTLSTTTPGITILQRQSAYADLTPGVSGNNTVAFEIDSAPDIPVGTAVEFTLTINYSGGSTTRTLTLAPTTGALGPGRLDSDADGIADWWTLQNFGHRTAQVGDLSRVIDIPFADGSPNLLKYALGFGAQTGSLQSRLLHGITTATGQDYLYLTYTRPDPARDGLTHTVETSDTLTPLSWSSLGTVEMGNTASGGLRTITVRSTSPIAPGAKRFIRLNVSAP